MEKKPKYYTYFSIEFGKKCFSKNTYCFSDSHWEIESISTKIMFWVNCRCVSYCLDNIGRDVVEETTSHFWNFIEMLSFCFYIPLCITGPLITFTEYKKGVS